LKLKEDQLQPGKIHYSEFLAATIEIE